ncbi:BrnT family toxin [Avibacterium paragallinarum]|uniref:BrnT family toxin n=1 Tax=Avibacterium paragallinarum TaxID=728 RepID=UPI00397A983A
MKIEFDPNKSLKNEKERGLSFSKAIDLDWTTALIWQDLRFNYPEPRYIALGLIDDRVHMTPIEQGVRVISFRKANKREVKRYVESRK